MTELKNIFSIFLQKDVNEADPTMIINVQDFELNIQNINSQEGKSNLMILTNDEFGKIQLSWKNFKEFYRVLDVSTYSVFKLWTLWRPFVEICLA